MPSDADAVPASPAYKYAMKKTIDEAKLSESLRVRWNGKRLTVQASQDTCCMLNSLAADVDADAAMLTGWTLIEGDRLEDKSRQMQASEH